MTRLQLLRAAIATAGLVLVGAATACAPDRALLPPTATRARIPVSVPAGETSGNAWVTGISRAVTAHCTRREALSGSALIGPSGGTLQVGNNQLIVPAGALSEPTLITGIVPSSDSIASIRFEPHGLTFKKPAGLIMDAAGCDVPVSALSAPDVVYLNDAGEVIEYIRAVFDNAWHTVAAPIEHFSQYAVAV